MRDDQIPVLSPGVEVHVVEDGGVAYVPAGQLVHFLNETAMAVLEQCNGMNRWDAMQAVFEAEWGPPGFDVRESILPQFETAGLIEPADTPDEPR